MKTLLLLLGIACLTLMIGCSDDDDDSTVEPSLDISGTWNVSIDGVGSGSMTLQQSGSNVTGTLNAAGESAAFNGSISGNTLNGTVTHPLLSNAEVSVTFNGDNSFAGTYSSDQGSGSFSGSMK